ncbi:MAG: TRAP transporter permease [Deltaproteobacteria bacterium]|nr:TRAP transporter permease [Deltaproteobacteria bacterium]
MPLEEKPLTNNGAGDGQEEPINVDAVLEKFDPESRFLKLTGLWLPVAKTIAVLFSLFQLYTGLFGVFEAQIQRPTHLMFALALVFLLYPFKPRKGITTPHPVDLALAVLSVTGASFSIINYEIIVESAGLYSKLDFAVALLGIALTLEATRRIVGLPIVIIASLFMVYAYLGAYFPGFLAHRGFEIKRIATQMWFTTEGIMGVPLGVSANFIFLFILFGAFLTSTGIMDFFMDISYAVAGWASGGPAKIAVIGSALEGTVSGSSVANTVGSGSFTIPMMKRLGYKPEFAGAVEAAASTGGQIMPPVMGAAAFLMAEFMNVPYVEVAKAAVIPALLYFAGVFIVVHFEAKKCGLRGLSRKELPKIGKVLKERFYLILPLAGIIYFLVEGSTPMRAALSGLALCILVSMVRKETRLNLKKLLDTLESGARGALGVALACATAGIIVGVVTLTGLGLKMGDGLIALAGGLILPTLLFTMITSLILGMGAPTTANYVITSTVAAPALIKLGTPLMAAHMFVFYFGIVADITPPVALAAMAGAAIAKSDPMKTGVNATKLAIGAFIVPYIFVFSPALLMINATFLDIAQMTITAVFGMIGVGAAVEGWYWTRMAWWERIPALAAGLLLIDPGTMTDIIGVVLLGLLTFIQYRKAKSSRSSLRDSIAAAN